MHQKKPDWLKIKIQGGQVSEEVKGILKRLSLNTVCKEANCPNQMECFSRHTATFMILGRVCTRNCTFCNVTKGEPQAVDAFEPMNVAIAVGELKLRHAVITSVTRDDLEDGGAAHFAEVVKAIRSESPATTIELLIPDFKGDMNALSVVAAANPDIINHNIETVRSLYPKIRPAAVYSRSLELLSQVKSFNGKIVTKSGMMLGLGETEAEVVGAMKDLRQVSCDILTLGQYLAPSKAHHPVIDYVHPDLFKKYREIGMEMGFVSIASAPLVRSSYHASMPEGH